ncbi:ATP-binding cassette domain-containing protein [Glutamicibacter bergerei]|uniref:ATP-binding cassette domain-containing protein n=2 Tax=Glutamicibacter TaxID=1742989 RepID=A0ABV9MKW3_9MICC|nr:ATP-binding cassette domain-containing protein [Glutamicibacter sp. BW77]PCC32685.1 hypothetical protein CIK74_15315 [Glutamicibacter sp. BW77]HBV10498.1 ABC transporter [Micrococcaceae bacterium]
MSTLAMENLSFSYPRSAVLLQNLNVVFGPGRTALLGPNGAGKSTLIALLATVLSHKSGYIALNDSDSSVPATNLRKYRQQISWLPQDFVPVGGLTVQDHVTYSAWLNGASRREAKRRAPAAISQVGLTEMAQSKATALSGGQQRRLGLAGALAHDAKVILLDEPTAGLDPNQRDRFQTILQGIDPEKIVLVSTHQTEDIDGTFDRICVLDKGQQKFHGSVFEFMAFGESETDPRDKIRSAYGRLVDREN